MTEEREHNLYTHVCFASIASGISLILSLVVMLRYNYRTNLEIDYLGAIAGVLSLFVAVFVGVQIYQSFNLKRDIDEQNKRLLKDMKDVYDKESENKFKEWSDDNQAEMLSAIYYSQGVYDYNNEKYESALEHFSFALKEVKLSKYKRFSNMICDFLGEYESLVIHQNHILNVSDTFLRNITKDIEGSGYEKEKELIALFKKIRVRNDENLKGTRWVI